MPAPYLRRVWIEPSGIVDRAAYPFCLLLLNDDFELAFADTAVRLGRYLGNGAQFRLAIQGQYDTDVVEQAKGAEIARRVRRADARRAR
jgi:hypothetical protein